MQTNTTAYRTYSGPHIARALTSLRCGCRIAAASWMNRDIGEETRDAGELAHRDSLRMVGDRIEYMTVGDYSRGMSGDGI